MNTWTIYLISFVAFVTALALVQGLYMLWQSLNVERTVRVNRRLRSLSAGGVNREQALSLLRQRALSDMPWLNRVLLRIPRMHAVDRMLEQAGLDITVSRYMLIQVMLSLVLLLILLLFTPGNPFVVVPVAFIAGFFIPYLYVMSERRKRLELLSSQLPDAMDFLARSMRAGNPFSASLRNAGAQLHEPIASEFRTTFEEMNFGLDVERAMLDLGERVGNEELQYFITAVLIQRTTGGNLAEVLNRIAAVMRARETTRREVLILSAEMKYSANVLIALPFIVAGALTILNPGYLATLFDSELGLAIIGMQLLLMATGYAVVQKMVDIRV